MATSSTSPSEGQVETISDVEARNRYRGFPSQPLCIARSNISTRPWSLNGLNEASLMTLWLPDPGCTNLSPEIWHKELAKIVERTLSENNVSWTSVDLVRIGRSDDGETAAQTIVWVGVKAKSLTREKGQRLCVILVGILRDHGVDDVEVEFRESSVSLLVNVGPGPSLLAPNTSDPFDFAAEQRHCFTWALGIPIAVDTDEQRTTSGTAALFLDGGKLLLTARHVVLPAKQGNSRFAAEESSVDYNVVAPPDSQYEECSNEVDNELEEHEEERARLEKILEELGAPAGGKADTTRVQATKRLHELVTDKCAAWRRLKTEANLRAKAAQRIIGRVLFSPPLRFGVEDPEAPDSFGWTHDVALVEVDTTKIPGDLFNAIDLCNIFTPAKFAKLMDEPGASALTNLLHNRLLCLQETSVDLDKLDKPLPVVKNGAASGVRLGTASVYRSFVRQNDCVSWEIPIVGRGGGKLVQAFAASGDSGSIVSDAHGRLVGLLTSGTAEEPLEEMDISYATPYRVVLAALAEFIPNVASTAG
uniref:Uncharacterized protein n=1 Tax=Mycena chlorophos TaxID=658473 RepID=A0ABQ0M700_MYCCL|nr:predicted protein [Mycena chlorophos]